MMLGAVSDIVWLAIFIAYPLSASWQLDGASRIIGLSLTLVFAVVFYLAMAVGGVVVAASTLLVAEAAQRLIPGWTHDWATTFGISISGFAMVMALIAGDRARAVRASEEENRRLEREAERLRLSQDVHDVLGHSLTVIALKAQLAAKLQAAGAPEAATHIREIETLARRALADVRTTVQGTRRISPAEELVTATRALRADGITVEAPPPSMVSRPSCASSSRGRCARARKVGASVRTQKTDDDSAHRRRSDDGPRGARRPVRDGNRPQGRRPMRTRRRGAAGAARIARDNGWL